MEENREAKQVANSNRQLSSVQIAAKSQHNNNISHVVAPANCITKDVELDNGNYGDDKDNDRDVATENIGFAAATSKKGVLWQQQNYDKFHQRLFSRWKKRYFILTTDYLVCFKRSAPKVGRSEMGKFLYKTALSDVTKIEWLKPKKSDKGAIVLHLNRPYNLLLWTKHNLNEWMTMIDESIQRNKIRRSFILRNGSAIETNNRVNSPSAPFNKDKSDSNDIPRNSHDAQSMPAQLHHINDDDELYENTAIDRKTTPIDSIIEKDPHLHATQNDHPSEEEVNNNIDDDRDESSSLVKSKHGSLVIKSQSTIAKSQVTATDQSRTNTESPVVCRHKPQSRRASEGTPGEARAQEKTTGSMSTSERDAIKRERAKESTDYPHDVEAMKCAEEQNADQASGRAEHGVIYGQPDSNNDDNGNGLASAITATIVPTPDKPDEDPNGNDVSNIPGQRPLDNLAKPPNRRALSQVDDKSPKSSPARDNKKKAKKKGKSSLVKKKEEPQKEVSEEAPDNSATNEDGKVQCDQVEETTDREETKCNSNRDEPSPKIEASSQERKEKTQHQPQHNNNTKTNLIRRDNSWQSLVSLTRVGKVTPAMQVAKRSLYAQHIMPVGDIDKQFGLNDENRISIESAVTPSRVSMLSNYNNYRHQPQYRQQQHPPASAINQRRFRPLPPLANGSCAAQLPHAPASFDVSAPNSPALSSNQRSSSYKQKLLQLQLLHNSNHVDYIRHNGPASGGCGGGGNHGDLAQAANDYGIYDASASQLYGYGYSSMRSQLKSAASEFSFIRPSSISTTQQPSACQADDANFLHQAAGAAASGAGQSTGYVLHSPNTRSNIKPAGLRHQQHQLILSNSSLGVGRSECDNINNSNDLSRPCVPTLVTSGESMAAKQYLVHPVTGERIINQAAGDSLLAPPMRELPLKPNKKRQTSALNSNQEIQSGAQSNSSKSSSLTASIACFFRRAFSRRRSKQPQGSKKRRSKLAESSSSLGATFNADDSLGPPLVPSAFSTGSKSVNGHQTQHQQRMVDMIEAFTNQTQSARLAATPLKNNLAASGTRVEHNLNFNLDAAGGTPRQRLKHAPGQSNHQHQFGGSPLHKSNSISATMGLSYTNSYGNDGIGAKGAALLYDNAMLANGASSPMMTRNSKVLSANLTPLFSRGEPHTEQVNHRIFMSPRTSHLPRPSSIYGQPSMISSPVFAAQNGNEFAADRLQFGAHRNSFHNQHFRERSSDDLRSRDRQHQHQLQTVAGGKMPFSLDTTREVAEEVSSPTTADAPPLPSDCDRQQTHDLPLHHLQKQYSGPRRMVSDAISASPSSGRLYQQRHQAIVNPILQSPTMSTIYDNHPNVMQSDELGAEHPHSSYSHYDNHNQLLLQNHRSQHLSPSLVRSSKQQQIGTPSHQRSVFEVNERALNMLINNVKKPSAIVAPTTPNHNSAANMSNSIITSSNPKFRSDLYATSQTTFNVPQSPIIRQPPASRSPMLSRRAYSSNQQHYQQSPLVSQQTRLLNRGDGVQATILDHGESNCWPKPTVVNIAGAPGINLDPTLAASILRGTNIEAYESSTFDRNSISSNNSNNNHYNKPKTFLVSTRLSKSMAYSQSSGASNDNEGSTSSMLRDDISSQISSSNNTTNLRSSRDELSSSGSRSINSSIGERGSLSGGRLRKSSKVSTESSGAQVDGDAAGGNVEQSSGSDTHGGPKSVIASGRRKSGSSSLKRGSNSSGSCGGEMSQIEDNMDANDGLGRNWINSKLAAAVEDE